MEGPSGKTLPCPEMVEFPDPENPGELNTTKKVGTLLRGRPDKNIYLTENIFERGKKPSGAASVEERRRHDDVVKAVKRPEVFEFPGHGANNISLGHLKNHSLWSHTNKKGALR